MSGFAMNRAAIDECRLAQWRSPSNSPASTGNFAVSHDDGNKPDDIPFADVVLIGVSRFGLNIEYDRLLEHGKKREERMGRVGITVYSRPSAVFEELDVARRIYRKGGFPMVEVTDKPIEIIADEIIALITRNLNQAKRRPLPRK